MNRQPVGLILAVSVVALGCAGCGGGSSKSTQTTPPMTTTGQNVASISVNSGPTGNYANGVFASVTVCTPSTSTCQTIPDLLVDTGSTGLRILASALTISLTQQTGSGGSPIAECLPFLDGYTWGPVQTTDIKIAGESASSLPIQVISTTIPVPTGCSNMGGTSLDSLQTLGANGILGVGLFAQDCGTGCTVTSSSDLYYLCPSSGCQVVAQPLAKQVQNPVTQFASDNNGVILQLPAVSAPTASISGSLVFGIGTQSNNALNGATVYTADSNTGNFTSSYNNNSYSNSFIDSGSNGYFFLNSSATGMPDCTTATGFYCPMSTKNFTVTNQGANGASGMVTFSVTNAESLFSNADDFVFNTLGGAGSGFDWGLPFFFGRNVFVGIEGKSTPGGTGPYWAY
jgi:hypothetical protein